MQSVVSVNFAYQIICMAYETVWLYCCRVSPRTEYALITKAFDDVDSAWMIGDIIGRMDMALDNNLFDVIDRTLATTLWRF